MIILRFQSCAFHFFFFTIRKIRKEKIYAFPFQAKISKIGKHNSGTRGKGRGEKYYTKVLQCPLIQSEVTDLAGHREKPSLVFNSHRLPPKAAPPYQQCSCPWSPYSWSHSSKSVQVEQWDWICTRIQSDLLLLSLFIVQITNNEFSSQQWLWESPIFPVRENEAPSNSEGSLSLSSSQI